MRCVMAVSSFRTSTCTRDITEGMAVASYRAARPQETEDRILLRALNRRQPRRNLPFLVKKVLSWAYCWFLTQDFPNSITWHRV